MSARVLVVTAGMGAGHTEVAAELARRLRRDGAACEVVDVLRLAGRPGRRLRTTYRTLLRYAPAVYGAAMWVWARWPMPLEAFTAATAGPFEAALLDAVRRVRPDVIVSTYNLSSQALGRLVHRGDVTVPVVTLVVDPGAHPYWVSRDVNLHLALTARTAARLACLGAPRVALVAPVLRPAFELPPSRAEARVRIGLPSDRRVAVLTAGSWAAGHLERTLDIVRRSSDVLPIVLCGRDADLRRRLDARGDVRAWGWTTRMPELLAAADVVVDNAGGLTCWEALACGARVVLYHPLPGHGRLNAATLDELGLARWARTERQLENELIGTQQGRPRQAAYAAPHPQLVSSRRSVRGGDAAGLVLAAAEHAR